jgi:hypothetical protein
VSGCPQRWRRGSNVERRSDRVAERPYSTANRERRGSRSKSSQALLVPARMIPAEGKRRLAASRNRLVMETSAPRVTRERTTTRLGSMLTGRTAETSL